MDFLKDRPGALFRKYLAASLGSALIVSVYSTVDMVAIGQSEGPVGAAAMAVLLVPFGLYSVLAGLCGIGGAVRMANARGRGDRSEGDQYFTAATIMMAVLTLVLWALLYFWRTPVMIAFGAADEATLRKTLEYADLLLGFMPAFVFSQFMGAFIRNDGAPNLVLAAVIAGGALNIFGDWYLVFPLDMGMRGAALATVSGTCLQCLVLCTHFFRRSCRLRFARVADLGKKCARIAGTGLGAAILALGNVVVVALMNNQIVAYGATTELAVYGVISSVSALFQAMFSGVGEAMQPLVSSNLGGRAYGRVLRFWHYGLISTLIFAAAFVLISELWPGALIRLFVDATPEVDAASPQIVRLYSTAYAFLGINIVSTYFLQSVLQDRQAMTVAVLRSLAAPAVLVHLLPLLLGISGIWLAVPVSEAFTSAAAVQYIRRSLRQLVAGRAPS